jgi:anhydro-N-acetylmuramic acid kinase
MTAQLGDGAAIAAETQLPVVTDLRALDVALGGQGAPIVPIGEKLLLGEYDFFLNIGGIANISFRPHLNSISHGEGLQKNLQEEKSFQYSESSKAPPSEGLPAGQAGFGEAVAFDVCPANRVLNMRANEMGKEFDEDGKIEAS